MTNRFKGHIGKTYHDSIPWWPETKRALKDSPNIMFIVLDDVGFAQLGCYGSTIKTPYIDKLASNGIRYNNFHTTAMCSPTRASLLTGRNHHSVGMGAIVEWSTGFPGYTGQVDKSAGTIAEILSLNGYNNFAVGKWHMMRMTDATAIGPFDYWPIGRGFDRYYGFLSSHADHWNPELFEDNKPIKKPNTKNYHLTEDLADQAIQMIKSQKAVSPEKPFFMYFAPGAAHSPHQVPNNYVEEYYGKFDSGWDETRKIWFEKQKQIGIVPDHAELTNFNSEVTPWNDLSNDEKKLCSKMQEVFAGFLTHTDEQIGRLILFLEEIDQIDNTMIVLLSDNGATDEGGEFGNLNIRKHYSFIHESFEELYKAIDRYGSEFAYNLYPKGWGHAGNTPLQWYKMDTYGGGIRDPLIIQWPSKILDKGGIREQFHHCTDIVPTILDVLSLESPDEIKGISQLPMHGTSMKYSFSQTNEKTKKKVQYFEMLGDRGIWANGWKAVTRHKKGEPFEDDKWELYHIEKDFSEKTNVASQYPDKLKSLVEMWWAEAGKYDVLPLDDRDRERLTATLRATTRKSYRYYQNMYRVDRLSSPNISNTSYKIHSQFEMHNNSQGVILAAGNRFGGYVFYIKEQFLHYEYIFDYGDYKKITSNEKIKNGKVKMEFYFKKTGKNKGKAELLINNVKQGSLLLENLWPIIPNASGVHCGHDDGASISQAYESPFTFNGKIDFVEVTVGDDQEIDYLSEYNEAIMED